MHGERKSAEMNWDRTGDLGIVEYNPTTAVNWCMPLIDRGQDKGTIPDNDDSMIFSVLPVQESIPRRHPITINRSMDCFWFWCVHASAIREVENITAAWTAPPCSASLRHACCANAHTARQLPARTKSTRPDCQRTEPDSQGTAQSPDWSTPQARSTDAVVFF